MESTASWAKVRSGGHDLYLLVAQLVDCALGPVQVEILEAYEPVKRVTCGGNFTVAFSDSGSVYSWGEYRGLKVSSLRGLCPDLISSGALDTVVARCAYFLFCLLCCDHS